MELIFDAISCALHDQQKESAEQRNLDHRIVAAVGKQIRVVREDFERTNTIRSIALKASKPTFNLVERQVQCIDIELREAPFEFFVIPRLIDGGHHTLNHARRAQYPSTPSRDCRVRSEKREQSAATAEESDEAEYRVKAAVELLVHCVEPHAIADIKLSLVFRPFVLTAHSDFRSLELPEVEAEVAAGYAVVAPDCARSFPVQ